MPIKIRPSPVGVILEPMIRQRSHTENIMGIQRALFNSPEAMFGDCFPLKHTFADGMYVREITVPPGVLVVTKIHKFSHPVFLLKGDVSVLEETGPKRIQAPCYFITPAGTKRSCYTHSEVVWITVHATDETDLDKIEEDIITEEAEEFKNFGVGKNKGELACPID